MPADAADYCEGLVRAHDEDRWLSLRYAPARLRPALAAIYALHLELERIPRLVREAAAGAIRLQWWSDSLRDLALRGARPTQPVLQALAAAGLDASRLAGIEEAIAARAMILEAPRFSTLESFSDWCAKTENWLVAAALGALAPEASAKVKDAFAAATAFALARHGPGRAPQFAAAAAAQALALHQRSSRARFPEWAAPALAHFALTPAYARGQNGAMFRRLRIFTAIVAGRF